MSSGPGGGGKGLSRTSKVGALLLPGILAAGVIWFLTNDDSPRSTPTPTPAVATIEASPQTPASAPSGCAEGAACLSIRVDGPGAVQVESLDVVCPPTCEIEYPAARTVDVQRVTGLSPDEEDGARILEWGGACAGLDAGAEPRGGRCEVRVDGDVAVTVRFEARPRLRIAVTGRPNYAFDLEVGTPQASAANAPFGLRQCASTPCEYASYYDAGTRIMLTPRTPANLSAWGGLCSSTPAADAAGNPAQPCTFELGADTEVTLEWAEVNCSGPVGAITCTFSP